MVGRVENPPKPLYSLAMFWIGLRAPNGGARKDLHTLFWMVGSNDVNRLVVAGGGFEPPTFGL